MKKQICLPSLDNSIKKIKIGYGCNTLNHFTIEKWALFLCTMYCHGYGLLIHVCLQFRKKCQAKIYLWYREIFVKLKLLKTYYGTISIYLSKSQH